MPPPPEVAPAWSGPLPPAAKGGLFALNAKTGFRGVYNYKVKAARANVLRLPRAGRAARLTATSLHPLPCASALTRAAPRARAPQDKFKSLLRYRSNAYSCGYHDSAEAAARAFDAQARLLGVDEDELNFPNDVAPPTAPTAPREPGSLFSVNAGTGFRGVYTSGKGKFQARVASGGWCCRGGAECG